MRTLHKRDKGLECHLCAKYHPTDPWPCRDCPQQEPLYRDNQAAYRLWFECVSRDEWPTRTGKKIVYSIDWTKAHWAICHDPALSDLDFRKLRAIDTALRVGYTPGV